MRHTVNFCKKRQKQSYVDKNQALKQTQPLNKQSWHASRNK